MKTRFILIALVLLTTSLSAQRGQPAGPPHCENFSSNIDSVLFMSWNAETSAWFLTTIRPYEYSQDKLTKFFTVIPISRDTTQKWEYFYNSDGNRDFQLYSVWSGTEWTPVQKTETEYDVNNLAINQLLSDWRNGEWGFRLYYIFEYENGIRTRHIWQQKDSQGNLFDYWHYYYTYSNDKLSEQFVVRVADNYPIRKDVYSYDSKGRVSEVIRLQPINKHTTELTNFSRRTYSYDQFGLLTEVLFESWQNDEWVNATLQIYHRRIDNAKKVTVCLNGRSLCVAKQAVPGLLRAGATLGACPVTVPQTRRIAKEQADNKLNKDSSISFYPNPATESINVIAGESYSRVELINSNGQTVRAFPLQHGDLTVIERNGLPSGVYFLRFVGQEEVKTEKVIFR